MKINQNFFKIESSYLFSTVARKQREYQEAHPEADIIRLSIGDVTRPLAPSVIDAMHKAVDEMANEATFRGYPPEHGYEFILDAIQQHDYAARGVNIEKDEIFLSDGAKSDCGNIGDLFRARASSNSSCTVLVNDGEDGNVQLHADHLQLSADFV